MDPYLTMVRLFMEPPYSQPLERALESAQVPAALRDQVRSRLEQQARTQIERPHVLSRPGGRRAWFRDWDPSTGYYWTRQRHYLVRLGRTSAETAPLMNAVLHTIVDRVSEVLSDATGDRHPARREIIHSLHYTILHFVATGLGLLRPSDPGGRVVEADRDERQS